MKILTEKVVIKGVNCRKITGFEGFKPASQLPRDYLIQTPSVHACGVSICREFDGKRIRLGAYSTRSSDPYNGISFNFPPGQVSMDDCSDMICVDSVIPETTFQKLVEGIKMAKDHLENMWSGIETGDEMEFSTEKVMVNGVQCRKILKIPQLACGAWYETPDKTARMQRTSSFCVKIFDGERIQLGSYAKPDTSIWISHGADVDLGMSNFITEGSIIPEITYQKLVAYIKNILGSWHGVEEVLI